VQRFSSVYRKNPAVAQIAERLVDLDEGFMGGGIVTSKWFSAPSDETGTGGSAGAEYLLTS